MFTFGLNNIDSIQGRVKNLVKTNRHIKSKMHFQEEKLRSLIFPHTKF